MPKVSSTIRLIISAVNLALSSAKLSINIKKKILEVPRIEPGAAGCEAIELSIVPPPLQEAVSHRTRENDGSLDLVAVVVRDRGCRGQAAVDLVVAH